MSFRHIRRRIGLILPKFGRGIKRNIFCISPKMNREEREITSIIRNLLENPENKVVYSVNSKSIRIQTKDKKYVIALTAGWVRINFVDISINERIGSKLFKNVISRIENEISVMDNDVASDHKEFLRRMNGIFMKSNAEFSKRSEAVKNASQKNIESALSRILKDSMME
jgi:tRNA(Ile)-lysidine synthase TilS/MesJ